jgi:hypothetical protein
VDVERAADLYVLNRWQAVRMRRDRQSGLMGQLNQQMHLFGTELSSHDIGSGWSCRHWHHLDELNPALDALLHGAEIRSLFATSPPRKWEHSRGVLGHLPGGIELNMPAARQPLPIWQALVADPA